MKKIFWALAALLVLALTACGDPAPDPRPELTPLPAAPGAAYSFPKTVEGAVFPSGARYDYAVPKLHVDNFADLTAEEQAKAVQVTRAFNQKMDRVLADALTRGEAMGRESQETGTPAPYDELTASVAQVGRVLSVRLDSSTYAGGAHPMTAAAGYLFDLDTGEFFAPAALGEDPAAFRQGVAALLTAKAEAEPEEVRAGYWPSYRDVLSRWDRAAVVLSPEGMEVTFSLYELGPYALGEVRFALSFGELAELLGPGGLAKVGLTTEPSH